MTRIAKAAVWQDRRMSGRDSGDDDYRALYREPLQGFIAARDAVVKALRDAGRAEEASRVKALRKPSVPAWALNQLADRDPEGIQTLLHAGAEIRAAQQAALSSEKHADRLREATAARRTVVDRLSILAADILVEAGHSATSHAADVRATLEATSVDTDAADRLRAGTLDRAIAEAVGFGDMFGLRSVPDVSEPASASSDVDEGSEAVSKAEVSRLRRDRDAATRKAHQAREAANRLVDQIGAMQTRLEELREKHAGAESRALEAELEAKRAEDAFRAVRDSG
jgi:hypothetical protein